MNFHRIHTVIVLLANGYLEVSCANYDDASELRRRWFVRRTVDHNSIVWC
jgi:hypothetical protein